MKCAKPSNAGMEAMPKGDNMKTEQTFTPGLSLADEYDKSNRNAFGKLYSPSQKFGVVTTAPNGAVASTGSYQKARSVEIAMDWVTAESGRTATVYRRANPKCKMVARYWNDGQLQSIQY